MARSSIITFCRSIRRGRRRCVDFVFPTVRFVFQLLCDVKGHGVLQEIDHIAASMTVAVCIQIINKIETNEKPQKPVSVNRFDGLSSLLDSEVSHVLVRCLPCASWKNRMPILHRVPPRRIHGLECTEYHGMRVYQCGIGRLESMTRRHEVSFSLEMLVLCVKNDAGLQETTGIWPL